jgi:hypothetical protein
VVVFGRWRDKPLDIVDRHHPVPDASASALISEIKDPKPNKK